MQNDNQVKELITEVENYELFVKYLKDNKGYDYTIEECYNMVQYFKDTSNARNLNIPQHLIFMYGRKEADFFIAAPTQCERIFELYYILKHGLNPVSNLNK